jgi:hypothetical protein
MINGIAIKRPFHLRREFRNRQRVVTGAKPKVTVGCVPRISRLMALAIRFNQLIHDGTVSDQATLARIGHVSRARLTQIMDLLNLAPDIQESLLELTPSQNGRDTISERQLRTIATQLNWSKQQQLLSRLLAK